MVVDLPQPLEPRKPKISPRSIDRRDVVDRGEAAEAARQALGIDGDFRFAGRTRRDGQLRMPHAFFLRQQGDEAFLQIFGACPLHQLRRRSCRQHPSGVHRDDPVPLLRFVHVGGGNDDAHAGAACANIVNERPELPPGERIDAGGGLIENEKIRFVDQRAAEPHLLFHSARELAGGTFGKRAKSGGIEQFFNADRTLRGG